MKKSAELYNEVKEEQYRRQLELFFSHSLTEFNFERECNKIGKIWEITTEFITAETVKERGQKQCCQS